MLVNGAFPLVNVRKRAQNEGNIKLKICVSLCTSLPLNSPPPWPPPTGGAFWNHLSMLADTTSHNCMEGEEEGEEEGLTVWEINGLATSLTRITSEAPPPPPPTLQVNPLAINNARMIPKNPEESPSLSPSFSFCWPIPRNVLGASQRIPSGFHGIPTSFPHVDHLNYPIRYQRSIYL